MAEEATVVQITCDISQVERLFGELTDEEAVKAIRSALRRQLNVIRRGVRKEFRQDYPTHRKNVRVQTKSEGWYYPGPVWNDIKLSVSRKEAAGYVSLCVPRKKPNRSYVLRFLNAGTSARATKKGANRGSVKGSGFFAAGSAATQDEAARGLETSVSKIIDKIVRG